LFLLAQGCHSSSEEKEESALKAEDFQQTVNGKETNLFSLKNGDIEMSVTNFGARIVSLRIPDRQGEYADVVLGFESIDDYLNANEPFHGATIGRVANRIADGKFTLDGTEYTLPINNETNQLHGGEGGFHNVVWEVKVANDTSIVMSYLSEDEEMGYPGNLNVEVTYRLSPANELLISYEAVTDKRTPVMLTNHAFFNLGGEGSGTINDHVLEINADRFIVVDSTLIPTGEIAEVNGTVLDFRKPKRVGEDLPKQSENQHLRNGGGYDHNWILDKDYPGKMSFAGSILEPESGRKLTVYTEEPVLLFYGGNFLDGSDTGKAGKPFKYREAFCLETQHYPDSPNHDHFPSIILAPGEVYQTSSIYAFSIAK
jgi:aldose 1-epimerase